MRVLLADDQPEVRSALRLILEQEPELAVVGEVAEAGELLTQIRAIRPDLVLLDWELPVRRANNGKHGLGTTLVPNLHALYPNLSVVALSGRPEAHGAALAAGADGFVSKGDPPEQLLTMLHAIRRGAKR